MKLPTQFPYEHKINGRVFRIYSATQIRTQKDGTQAEYPSFLVTYYEGGSRLSIRKSSWADVETLLEEVVAAHRKNDPERLELTGRDRRIYLAALEALKPVGGEVDQAVRDYAVAAQLLSPHQLAVPQAAQLLADTLTRLGKTPLSTAIDFYQRHGETMTATRNVAQVIAELIGDLKKDRRGHYHIRDMETRLERFAGAFTGPIHEIQERAITEWLQQLRKIVWRDGKQVENDQGQPVSERTRNNYRAAICELFGFAKKRGYVPRDLPTEAAATVRMQVVPGKNHIITPDAAKRLLAQLPPHLVPYTVLKLFSGLRTEEAFGLEWEDLRFDSQAVIIEAKLAKLRQRRVPPILPNLAKWLHPFRGLTGHINYEYTGPEGVQRAVAKESRKIGVLLQRNTFRNCYISYRVAQPIAPAAVAAEAGTSVRMIESNYKELATKGEAERWFSICPSKSQLTDLRAFANTLRKRQPA